MRGKPRFWFTAALAGVCVALGVVVAETVLLATGAGLGAWLLGNQAAFAARAPRVAGIDLSMETDRDRIAVGESTAVHVRATLDDALPFALTVGPRLPPSADHAGGRPALSLPAGERTADVTFDVTSDVVGTLDVGPSTVEFGDSGGFFADSTTLDGTLAVGVQPRTPRRLHVGEAGRTLTSLYGEHKVGRVGAGTEPYEVREYAPGDQLSRIDWKATARLNHPHIREYERTRSHETVLVVDQRSSMGVGREGETKLDYLREVALAFVDSASGFGDPLGLYTVGDGDTETTREPAAGVEQYDPVRRIVRSLEPTAANPGGTTSEPISPTRARTVATRLRRDDTPFGSTLRPYFESSGGHARRLRERPLFRTVQLAHSRLGSGAWAVVLTDDSNPAEVREAVKVARRNEWNVLVFLAPSVLYEPGGLDDLERAYERYREFEEFRRSLARMDGVSAFEVTPGDRLERVIGKRDGMGRRSPTGGVVGAARAERRSRTAPDRDEPRGSVASPESGAARAARTGDRDRGRSDE